MRFFDSLLKGSPKDKRPSFRETGHMIGLWTMAADNPDGLLGFPHPASLVDLTWEAERRDRIVAYLRSGHTRARFMGHSFCRFEDCDHDERNALGSTDLTDGLWIWPEGLWHYVADHGIRLPDAFVDYAASHGFVAPQAAVDRSKSVDVGFWVRWVAENTAPPCGSPEACSLDEAQAICSELSTARWRASLVREHDRWRVRRESDTDAFEDFTGPISRSSLRAYLFRFRQPAPESVLSPAQAIAIASGYASDGRAARPFAGTRDANGQVWWALILSGTERPTVPLAEIDFNAIKIPTSGWAVFLPGGWKVEVARGMDEQAWRFFLEDWRRRVGLPVRSDASASEHRSRSTAATGPAHSP